MDTLRGCLDCTDWAVFVDASRDVDELTDCVTDYVSFCVDNVVPKKTVKIYSNNKPWVTKDIKQVLNKKKRAFKDRSSGDMKEIQREVQNVIRKGKKEYRKKVGTT